MTYGNAETFLHRQGDLLHHADQLVAAGKRRAFISRHGYRGDQTGTLEIRSRKLGHYWFREVLNLSATLLVCARKPVTGFPLHLGWQDQGTAHYGILLRMAVSKTKVIFALRNRVQADREVPGEKFA